jgi:transcription antitermination factor NusG
MLQLKGYEYLLPTYRTRVKWSDRTKELDRPLFQGYLFCQFDARRRVPILNTPGVLEIVRFGGQLAPIDDQELASIRVALKSGYTCVPWPHLEVGRTIRIGFGPFAGVTGQLVEVKGKTRMILSVTVLNRSISVEIDASILAPDALPHPAALVAAAR